MNWIVERRDWVSGPRYYIVDQKNPVAGPIARCYIQAEAEKVAAALNQLESNLTRGA